MAISIQVYPYLSPRLIEVLAPETEATLQELVDAIRAYEDSDIGQHYDYLIDGAGKEDLGGSISVGITATLRNAQIMFTGRTTPLDNGTGRTCDLTDNTGTHLFVDDSDFVADGIYRGCTVFNATTGEMNSVLEITDLNNIEMLALSGAGSLGWTSGDIYAVFPNVQCQITGGNLVAVDENGLTISPVFQTPNVQIIRSSSSSATLQELSAIEFGSFNGGVTIDVGNTTGRATSGTLFPIGTEQAPSDNTIDLHAIASERGLNKIYVLGDLTLTVDSSWDRHEFVGESPIKTIITLPAAVSIANCEFYDCTVTGTLDGNSHIERSVLLDLDFVDGFIFNCAIAPGTVTLGTNKIANILQCFSGQPGETTPIINMNGTGVLALRDYNGGIVLKNYSGNSAHSIDLASGQCILDSSTIVSGTFVVRGVGKLVDENNVHIPTGLWNNTVNIINELVSKANFMTETELWSKKASDNAEQANNKLN